MCDTSRIETGFTPTAEGRAAFYPLKIFVIILGDFRKNSVENARIAFSAYGAGDGIRTRAPLRD